MGCQGLENKIKGVIYMNHSFNVAVAAEYGMLEAVLLEYLNFWITKNKANDVQYYDGHYWTYNSTKALAGLFPYASRATISRALRHLEEEGLILSGNYNKSAYDRTMWYTLEEKGILVLEGKDASQSGDDICHDTLKDRQSIAQSAQSIAQNGNLHCSKCEMENYKMSNGSIQNEQPIPVINTVIDTDNNLTVSKDTVCRADVQRIMGQWNSLTTYGINPIGSLNPKTKRYDMLRARIRSYGIDKVLEAIGNIKKSAFLCGDNKNGWSVTFDWFVRPNNFIKVLEGNYDSRADATPADTGQHTGKSGYPLELLESLAGGGAGRYGQA